VPRPREIVLPQITLGHDAYGFDIEGDADALRHLADAIEQHALIEVSGSDGAPASLRVMPTPGLAVMSNKGNHATVAGNARSLQLLAANLRALADSGPSSSGLQRHSHLEYIPGHVWLAEDSVPVAAYLRPGRSR
jgi:hypothetical protein